MDLSRFYKMDLPTLEENAYALQIKYNPPLQEKDRNYIIRKIENLYQKMKDVDFPQERSSKRKNKKCLESTLLSSGENEKEYKIHMLVFVPYTMEGVEVYRCFDRYELRQYMQAKKDPYTGEPFTPKQLKVIEKALSIPYPTIPVGSRMEEIQRRLFMKESGEPIYLSAMQSLKNKLEPIFHSDYLEHFCSELTPSQYYLFTEYGAIMPDMSRDEAAYTAIRYIEDNYLLLKNSKEEAATQYLFSMGNAMDEFYYMIYHKLSYAELLEQKGKEVIGDVKELFWKPSFLVEKHHENGILSERYYLTPDGNIRDGARIFYDIYGNPIQEFIYQDGQPTYVNVYTNKIITERYPMKNSVIHGNALLYYGDGEKKMAVVSYEDGMKKGWSLFFFPNGNTRSKYEYALSEKEKKSILVGEPMTFYEDGTLKKKMRMDENGHLLQKEIFYPNETLQEKKLYQNGVLQGEYVSYYSTGKLWMEASFEEGKMEGVFKSFHENGNPQEISYFVDGRLEGLRTLFYATGEKEMEVFMENGKESGAKTEYYANGLIRSVSSYKMGELDGRLQSFYEDGSQREDSIYQNGERHGLCILYHPNGVKKEEGEYSMDKRVGEHFFFYDNGNMRKKCFYRNGYKDGWTVTYYIDGALKKECVCVNGKKGGSLKKYDRNGILSFSGRCENKSMEGEYIFYFQNGEPKERGAYHRGKKNGVVVTYYPDGKEESRCEYMQDMLDGPSIYFFEDGKTPRRKCIYAAGVLENTETLYFSNGTISESRTYHLGELSGPYEKYYENGHIRESGLALPGLPLLKNASWDVFGKKEGAMVEKLSPAEVTEEEITEEEESEEEESEGESEEESEEESYLKSGEEDTIFSEEEDDEFSSESEIEEEWEEDLPPPSSPKDFYVEDEPSDSQKILDYDSEDVYRGEIPTDEE